MHVESGVLLQGQRASHPADIVIRNGIPRAALFAVPTIKDDRHLAYLYRDSLPAIVQDMGEDFEVFAVLPPLPASADPAEVAFIQETKRFLSERNGIATVTVSDLENVRQKVVKTLL